MTDLRDVWSNFGNGDDDERVAASHPAASGMRSIVLSNSGQEQIQSADDVVRDFVAYQAQRQRRELVVGVCALVLFAIVINHLDRLHTRLRTLEMMLSLMS